MEEICSGWLIKSPGTKYVTLFSKGRMAIQIPVKTRWRRRFFILYKPQGSLPHQYAFDYYKDDRRHRKRGSINLEECSKILSRLDSSHYAHLFSLRTVSHRQKERVYYLAADSEEEMNRWVCCLCRLCGLRSGADDECDSQPAPNPPERLDSMHPAGLVVDLPTNDELSEQILREIEDIEGGRLPRDTRLSNQNPADRYHELADCTTGDSRDSIPDRRPAPPPKCSPGRASSDLYDSPISHSIKSQKRAAHTSDRGPKDSSMVNVVKLKNSEMNGSNSSINSKLSHAFSRESQSSLPDLSSERSETYDVPIMRRPAEPTLLEEEVAPPPRPPKAGLQDDMYQNLPGDSSLDHLDDIYDIPKSYFGASPAPSPCAGSKIAHKYVNASTKYLEPIAASQPEDMYKNIQANWKDVHLDSLNHGSNPSSGLQTDYVHAEGKPDNQSFSQESGYISSPSSILIATQNTMPDRPFKPRNLSDNALDEREAKVRNLSDNTLHESEPRLRRQQDIGADSESSTGSRGPVRISQSFKTKAYVKDNVFSDTDEDIACSSREDIKLPARIEHQAYSSSEEDSSSSEDEPVIENQYQVPPSRPQTASHVAPVRPSPMQRRGTGKEPLKNGSAVAAPPVRRASSLSKVHQNPSAPAKSQVVNSSTTMRLSSVSGGKLVLDQWLRTARSGSLGVADRIQNRPPPEPDRDLQYVELDQTSEKPEQSPKLPKSSYQLLNNGAALANGASSAASADSNYTDIDMIKTKALTVTRVTRERDLKERKRSENDNQQS